MVRLSPAVMPRESVTSAHKRTCSKNVLAHTFQDTFIRLLCPKISLATTELPHILATQTCAVCAVFDSAAQLHCAAAQSLHAGQHRQL
jgi:hypothetical protein